MNDVSEETGCVRWIVQRTHRFVARVVFWVYFITHNTLKADITVRTSDKRAGYRGAVGQQISKISCLRCGCHQ